MWVVIPVKNLDSCKSRLAHALPDHARTALMGALLSDLLTMLQNTAEIKGVAVVTRCLKAGDLARTHGAVVLSLDEDRCLNSGVAAAVHELTARQINKLLILHADLPLINPADIASIIQQHLASSVDVSLVPDDQQNGTNAMLLRLPTRMQFYYGQNSFQQHLEFCQQQSISVQTMQNANAALDIDLWQDFAPLLSLRTTGNREHLARWLEQYDDLFDWPLVANL